MARFIRLIRLPNLLVVVVTQLLVYYRLFLPAYRSVDLQPVLDPFRFFQLVVITIAISASGFIINDLRDAKVDEINRPGTNPVLVLGRAFVQWLYALTILGGFLLSLIVAFRLDELSFLWLYPASVGVLALYSWALKGRPLIGNLTISAYCAAVPGIIGLAERTGLARISIRNPELALTVWRTLFIFMLFAFLATFLRELIKDIEDAEGDRRLNLRTFPVRFGTAASRRLAYLIVALTATALCLPIFLNWPSYQSVFIWTYIGILLFALLAIGFFIAHADDKKDWHRLSTALKLYLLLGLGLLAKLA
ncbi:MAG: UbiA family prenyltransferase [Bacteroidota bacterium]